LKGSTVPVEEKPFGQLVPLEGIERFNDDDHPIQRMYVPC
jgi:hypothetical protein